MLLLHSVLGGASENQCSYVETYISAHSVAFPQRETMEEVKTFSLPKLPYEYTALAPYISEAQLRIHHEKHHNAYVTGANNLFAKIDKARSENADFDVKAAAKELSWNVGGHVLHTLFWGNLAPKGKSPEKPTGVLGEWLNKEFGSFDRFKK